MEGEWGLMAGRVRVESSGSKHVRTVTYTSGYPHLAFIDRGSFGMVQFEFWARLAPLLSVPFDSFVFDFDQDRGLRHGKSRNVYQHLSWTELKNWCILPV